MTNRQEAWASDPRWARAKEHSMRGEVLHAEMLLRGLLAEHRDCTPARLAVADYMVERGDLDGALQWLRTPQEVAKACTDIGLDHLGIVLGTAFSWKWWRTPR